MEWKQKVQLFLLMVSARLSRRWSEMRFDMLSGLYEKDDMGESNAVSIKGKIELNGVTANMYEQKMLSRLLSQVIPHDGLTLRKAMSYVLGLDASEIKVVTMSASTNEEGQWRMEKTVQCVPLRAGDDLRDLLLQ